jgi:ABC-type nitrate/sulfonate/bicarbonate transport system permease component
VTTTTNSSTSELFHEGPGPLRDDHARPSVQKGGSGARLAPLDGSSRRRRFFRSRLSGWVLILVILAGWQVSSFIVYVPTISSPDKIATTWVQQIFAGQLLWSLLETLRTMAIGFVIAVPLGIVIGFLMGRIRVVWGLLEPLVELLRLTPATAVIPVFILFLGIGDPMKIAVFLVSSIFPLIMTSYAGARSVSQTLRETAQTYRLNWIQTQREVALPAAIPFILVGMRQALGLSLVMAVVIGMLAGNSGVGFFILMAQQALNIQALLAGVFTVALVGYGFNALFLLLERRYTRWRRTDSSF